MIGPAMKLVLTHAPGSSGRDLPWERFHFPASCLRQMEAGVGDLAIYYEPRRDGEGGTAYRGRQAYVAVARVTSVQPDPRRDDHYYAELDSYLEFERAVPVKTGERFFESGLASEGVAPGGAMGRIVRPIPAEEFEAIVCAGFLTAAEPSAGSGLAEPAPPLFRLARAGAAAPEHRLISRPFRDRAFAAAVAHAYDHRCALTGQHLDDAAGSGAIHLRPVTDRGPDAVRNGIALSGGVRALFQDGRIAIARDRTILTPGSGLPSEMLALLHQDRKARLPREPWLTPAAQFLEYHRERVFKG